MTYPHITTAADLPPEGPLDERAREKSDLDFKTFADPKKMWEHAKDIAAFSNAMGGVLLIGADDKSGRLKYLGIAGQNVKDIQGIYEAAAQLCSPPVFVDVVAIPQKNVVAINVDPHLDLVAAPAGTRDRNGVEMKHDVAWVFPIRRASQTDWIKPENLAMYMNKDVRRAVLLLAKIPEATRDKVVVRFHTHAQSNRVNQHSRGYNVAELILGVGKVSAEENTVALVKRLHEQEGVTCYVPLSDVLDVWRTGNDSTDATEHAVWGVLLRGQVVASSPDRPPSLKYLSNSRLP